MALTFRQGIHVEEYKNTRKCPIEKMAPPKTVSIPMSQHIGVHATPCVKEGDTVKSGQVIGIVGQIPAESLMPAHLHFECLKDGKFIDPMSVVK